MSPMLPVPGRRHVDALFLSRIEFRAASDVSKPASRRLGKRNLSLKALSAIGTLNSFCTNKRNSAFD